jgi:hypothetical protein
MTAFLNNFDPFRHDVLYGLQGSRETYVFAYIEKIYQAQPPEAKARFGAMEEGDQFPDDFASEVYTAIEKQGTYINSYNEPITSGDFSQIDRITLARPTEPRILHYHQLLSQTRYAVQRVGAATLRSLAKGDDRLASATGTATLSAQQLAALRLHLAVRRACKFGIEYISRQREVIVHYILDGIKSEDVVNKTSYGVMGGTKGLPITTSEIRYMFRNWFDLKNQAIERKIMFYNDQAEVRAPWYDAPTLWLPYAQHRVDKYTRANPRLGWTEDNHVEAFRRLSAQGRASDALQHFFVLPTAGGLT